MPINSGRRVGAVFASNDQAASHTLPCSHEKIPLQLKKLGLTKKILRLILQKTAFMSIIEYQLHHTHTKNLNISSQKTNRAHLQKGQTVLNPKSSPTLLSWFVSRKFECLRELTLFSFLYISVLHYIMTRKFINSRNVL